MGNEINDLDEFDPFTRRVRRLQRKLMTTYRELNGVLDESDAGNWDEESQQVQADGWEDDLAA